MNKFNGVRYRVDKESKTLYLYGKSASTRTKSIVSFSDKVANYVIVYNANSFDVGYIIKGAVRGEYRSLARRELC